MTYKYFRFIYCHFMYVNVLSVHHIHMWYPWTPEYGIEYLLNSVTDGCVSPCMCGESNLVFMKSSKSSNH